MSYGNFFGQIQEFEFWQILQFANLDLAPATTIAELGVMNTMMSQITSLIIVYSTVYSGTDQR